MGVRRAGRWHEREKDFRFYGVTEEELDFTIDYESGTAWGWMAGGMKGDEAGGTQ